ncbi:hypothetical protein BZK41_13230 [Citrobacter sp. A316]|nr:hypothetical protein BZK41_13230 [Citrobacter sp. A316]
MIFIVLYPSYSKLHVRWLTRITYQSKLIGTHSLAACLQLELFRVNLGKLSLARNEYVQKEKQHFA